MTAQWLGVADRDNPAESFGTEAGWSGVQKFCAECGAPWIETTNQHGAVAYCRDHPNEHHELVERVTGPPSRPLDVAEWAVDRTPTRPQSAAAAAGTRWLAEWVRNGLEHLPQLRRDLAADIDGGEGVTPSRTLHAVVSNPIGGDASQLSVDHIDLALKFLQQRINLGGDESV